MSPRMVYRVIWLLATLSIGGMSGYFLSAPLPHAKAAELRPFTTADGVISLKVPSNWEPNEAEREAVETGVEFVPAPGTRIVIRTTLQESLMADVAQANAAGLSGLAGAPAASSSPLETIHNLQQSRMKKEGTRYRGFTDESTSHITISGVDALATRFRYQTDVQDAEHDMVGKRISALVAGRGVSIVETCPAGYDKTIKPVFDAMLTSLEIREPRSGN